MVWTTLLALIFLPLYKKFLFYIGSIQYNYQKKLIPVSFGLYILFVETIVLLMFDRDYNWSYMVAFFIITIVGTIDDFYGDPRIKGLSGHIRAFFAGKITTGLLKAIVGGWIALFLGFFIGQDIIESLTIFLLILLMINMINLFDLRPGRALKVFFLFYFGLSISTPFLFIGNLALISLSILLIVFYHDLRGKIMLGDSGANLIGLHLGLWYSLYLSLSWQWLMIIVLILLHVYTERHSLSDLIEKNKLLKKIDLWGR
ncbi:hypothetical protein BHF71_04905 [Vulcanibacillus modesticaldus]|uniref:UDP-N-acetylmuramyl pentapeptide phosphotransferase n=1 Tax=Vulcanibacillus modesticaldus TaxID=337097 RepID=A0A1D2YRW3_9BACI|nr:hypothetical protein BHF71_04905 [Vulcanibacillus modesticaldus]